MKNYIAFRKCSLDFQSSACSWLSCCPQTILFLLLLSGDSVTFPLPSLCSVPSCWLSHSCLNLAHLPESRYLDTELSIFPFLLQSSFGIQSFPTLSQAHPTFTLFPAVTSGEESVSWLVGAPKHSLGQTQHGKSLCRACLAPLWRPEKEPFFSWKATSVWDKLRVQWLASWPRLHTIALYNGSVLGSYRNALRTAPTPHCDL